MKAMETLDAKDVVVADTNATIENAFTSSQDAGEVCSKSQIAIQNNIVNIRVNSEAGVCNDDYDAGF